MRCPSSPPLTRRRFAATLAIGSVCFAASIAHAVDFLRVDEVPKASPAIKGYGTSFVIAPGLLLTNEHVIRGAGRIWLTDTSNGRRAEAMVVSADRRLDLAVLRAAVSAKPLALAPADTLQPNLDVFSVGYPEPLQYGFDRKLAQGRIRLLHMPQMPERFTADLGVRSGDSGSPVFNQAGQVVGVISGGFSEPVLVNDVRTTYPPVAAGIHLSDLRSFLAQNGIKPQEYQLTGARDSVVQAVASSVLLVEVGS
jgi:S1-C subfamily serine protease